MWTHASCRRTAMGQIVDTHAHSTPSTRPWSSQAASAAARFHCSTSRTRGSHPPPARRTVSCIARPQPDACAAVGRGAAGHPKPHLIGFRRSQCRRAGLSYRSGHTEIVIRKSDRCRSRSFTPRPPIGAGHGVDAAIGRPLRDVTIRNPTVHLVGTDAGICPRPSTPAPDLLPPAFSRISVMSAHKSGEYIRTSKSKWNLGNISCRGRYQ